MAMTNHESGANLTPSEIAEITRKADLLFPESPQGYIAAACEYAAEIKRLREELGKQQEKGKALEAALKDIRDNYDHDDDAHRYGTSCRVCTATNSLKIYNS